MAMTRRIRLSLFAIAGLFASPFGAAGQSTPPPSTRADGHAREQEEKAKHTHPYVPGFIERQLRRVDGRSSTRPSPIPG
jgi:hypothetical protein